MFITISILFTSFLSVLVSFIYRKTFLFGYEIVWILPFSFIIAYLFIYKIALKNKNMKVTTTIILTISWLRCVFVPLIGSISGFYNSYSFFATSDVIQISIVLMFYEQLIISIFLFLFSYRKRNSTYEEMKTNLNLHGSRMVYIFYIIFSIIIYIFIGRNMDLFQLFVISAEGLGRRGDLSETSIVIIREIINIGISFFFLLVADKYSKLYYSTNRNIYLNKALIAATLLVGVIVGERRSTQVYLAFASIWILIRLFPYKKKKIIYTISIVASFVIGMMSIYKFFNAFNYGSYSVALENSNINLNWLASVLDSYFFGIKVVSSNIGYISIAPNNLLNMIYDFLRSTFGINFLVKGNMLTTSEIYNFIIYNGNQKTGHLFSSIGYGAIYLGYFLSPFMTLINIRITLALERILRCSKSLEMNYIISYVLMRFGFGIFGNPAPLISTGSTFLITNCLVFIGATLISNMNKNKKIYRNSIFVGKRV